MRHPRPLLPKNRVADVIDPDHQRKNALEERVDSLKKRIGPEDKDVVVRRIASITSGRTVCAIVFLVGLVDERLLESGIIGPLTRIEQAELSAALMSIRASRIESVKSDEELELGVYEGSVALIGPDGPSYLARLPGWPGRQIGKSETEPGVRGPKEAFSENLRDNLSLLRRRIKDSRLELRSTRIGRFTKTNVVMCYIDGLAPDQTINEVWQKLGSIDVDAILDVSYLEEYLQPSKFALFPLLASTERPDRLVSMLLQGRVGVLCDGSPFSLAMPTSILSHLQATDDYYQLSIYSLFLRVIRNIGLIAATTAPAIYVALSAVNPSVLPVKAVMTLIEARRGVPYPALVEVLIMDVALEILAEASSRLPTHLSPTATVAGGLILGTAAAQAGIVSSVMLVVVAIMSIGSFAIPYYQASISWRIVRFINTFFAAVFGLYGLATSILVVNIHLASLEAYGVPYTAPFAPWKWGDILRDTLIRLPIKYMQGNPESTRREDDGCI